MISPMYYSHLGAIRVVTEQDLKGMEVVSFNPKELIELKLMTRIQLLYLMKALGVRVYQDIPVMVCTDDELRSAYLVCRAWRCKHARNKWSKVVDIVTQYGFEMYDEIVKEVMV